MSPRTLMVFTSVALLTACLPTADAARQVQQLLETDRAWAAVAGAGTNLDSIVSFWTEDARVMMAEQPTYQGKVAIGAMVAASMAIPGFQVSWTPDSASVSASGDLGYTFGTNAFTVPDSAGTPVTTRGRYLTVWRREADGRWRCVMDVSVPGA